MDKNGQMYVNVLLLFCTNFTTINYKWYVYINALNKQIICHFLKFNLQALFSSFSFVKDKRGNKNPSYPPISIQTM